MAAQNSAGIQTLLDSEKESQKIVQKARQYRGDRMKSARTEAQKEIEDYRTQKEAEFKKFESEHQHGNKEAEEEAKKEAEVGIAEIKKSEQKSGNKVVEDLLRVITDVKPEVPDKIAVNS